jgi:hypothetical protein
MTSLRSHEGYLLIDHRNSPGVPDAIVQPLGLPLGAGRGVFEAATYTCKHCQRIVVMNPDRKRERAYCRGCDHLICDPCGAERARTLQCRTFEQVIDQILTSSGA